MSKHLFIGGSLNYSWMDVKPVKLVDSIHEGELPPPTLTVPVSASLKNKWKAQVYICSRIVVCYPPGEEWKNFERWVYILNGSNIDNPDFMAGVKTALERGLEQGF